VSDVISGKNLDQKVFTSRCIWRNNTPKQNLIGSTNTRSPGKTHFLTRKILQCGANEHRADSSFIRRQILENNPQAIRNDDAGQEGFHNIWHRQAQHEALKPKSSIVNKKLYTSSVRHQPGAQTYNEAINTMEWEFVKDFNTRRKVPKSVEKQKFLGKKHTLLIDTNSGANLPKQHLKSKMPEMSRTLHNENTVNTLQSGRTYPTNNVSLEACSKNYSVRNPGWQHNSPESKNLDITERTFPNTAEVMRIFKMSPTGDSPDVDYPGMCQLMNQKNDIMEKARRSEFNKDQITQHMILPRNSMQEDSNIQPYETEGENNNLYHGNHHKYQNSTQTPALSQNIWSDGNTYSNQGEYRVKYPIAPVLPENLPTAGSRDLNQRTLSGQKES
jgi:hypothetical protein